MDIIDMFQILMIKMNEIREQKIGKNINEMGENKEAIMKS